MLKISKIAFPGIGIGEFDVNSVAMSPFGIDIAWYALIITFGMVMCVLFASYRASKIGVHYEHILDMALFTITSGIIGARLYYVAVEYKRFDSFGEIFDIRGGGLAIYGGIIGGALAVYFVCKFKHLNFNVIADIVYPGVMLAQAIGRWGNFMNAEAYGIETTLPWGMTINGGVPHHPTFLYESLWNIIGFVVLAFVLYKRKQYDGQIYYLGAAYYGLGRFMIEGLRTDSMFIGEVRTNQFLAATAFVVYTTLLIYNAVKKTRTKSGPWLKEPKPRSEKKEKNKTKTENGEETV